MKVTTQLLPVLYFVCFVFSAYAQNKGTLQVQPVKPAYEWNEKITVQFSGLPQRTVNSNRYDDVIIVASGTPDNNYNDAQRLYVTSTGGQVEFPSLKAGLYEARIYLYEKPGVVAARSAPFTVRAIEEGPLTAKSIETLVEIASRNKRVNKALMCSAVNEYFNRKPAPSEPNYPGMKALKSLCPVTAATRPAPAADAPVNARYQCYRILNSVNQVAEDLFILPGNKYKTMNKTGNYTYNPAKKMLTFTSGPLFIPGDKWVGIYTGKGAPTPAGGRTVDAIIEIRRQSDVAAGNRKVLQICTCAQ